MSGHILIINGGTTNLRVTLIDASGNAIAIIKKDAGVSQTAIDGHNGRLKSALQDAIYSLMAKFCLTPSDIALCAAYGMITSREGLMEIPHRTAPADADQLHSGMVIQAFPEIAPFPIAFIPGVKNTDAPVTVDTFSQMDMMRGEETEAIGLFQLVQPNRSCVFVLPGSHNKLVKMGADGQIYSCMTTLSGELLSTLTHHTILAGAVHRSFATAETYDPSMALLGYREAEASGLGRAAFAGRILSTLCKQSPEKVASYLLGAVLHTDIQALQSYCDINTPLYIAGLEPIQTALCDLVSAAGFADVHPVSGDLSTKMGIAGAMHIARERLYGL